MNRGALGAVLRLSRAAGAAPCVWERDGQCRVSRRLLLYSGMLTTVMSGFVLVRTSRDLLGHEGPWLALDCMRHAGRLLAALLLALGAATAPRRLRRLAGTRALLLQIETKLPHCRKRREQKKAIGFVLASFAACFAMRVVDGLVDERSFQNVSTTLHQCALLFACYVESLTVLQMLLSARRVARSLTALNDGLELLVPDLYSHTNSNSKYELNAPAIRRHAECYAAVCHMVRGATEADGLYLAAMLVLCSLRLAITLYEVILWGLLINQLAASFLSTPLLYCALSLTTLVVTVEPCHATHLQMQRTHFLVTSLKVCCRDDARVSSELELFLRLLRLNKATYSPLGVCTLERSTTVTIFATIATYLVVVLTYGPELKNPALLAAYSSRIGQF